MFETERTILRSIVESDINHIYAGLSHPEVVRYYGYRCENLEDAERQIQWFAKLEESGNGKWWAICNKDSHAVVGAIGFHNHDRTLNSAEIGFWLLREHWGKGIMAEVLPVVTDHAMSEMHLVIIMAEVEVGNEASGRVLRNAGFSHIGTRKQAEIKNGILIDLERWELNLP